MIYKDDEFLNDFEDQPEQNEPNAYQVDKPQDNAISNAYAVKDDEFLNDFEDQPEESGSNTSQHDNLQDNITPNAYAVKDDEGIEEKDLKRSFLFGDAEMKPVREGQPMGGESFGQNNVTPSGDDPNNPSRNAGYSNAYFARTEPMEEHPENSNFTPDGNNQYQTGTADNDGQYQNASPGPVEITDKERLGLDDEFEDRRDIEPK